MSKRLSWARSTFPDSTHVPCIRPVSHGPFDPDLYVTPGRFAFFGESIGTSKLVYNAPAVR